MRKHIVLLSIVAVVFLLIVYRIYFSEVNKQNESLISGEYKKESELTQQDSSEKSLSNSEAGEQELLPDLAPIPPETFSIQFIEGKKLLRFPGVFANIGRGPLELVAQKDEGAGKIMAIQRIYFITGEHREKPVGTFVLHPTHSHWHFENFVEFSIHSITESGSTGDEILTTGKVTYCIHDYGPLSESLPGKPGAVVYPWCTESVGTQGISVGWHDTYTADVSGQELDITELPDGKYRFRIITDPDGLLDELSEENNAVHTDFDISGSSVQLIIDSNS